MIVSDLYKAIYLQSARSRVGFYQRQLAPCWRYVALSRTALVAQYPTWLQLFLLALLRHLDQLEPFLSRLLASPSQIRSVDTSLLILPGHPADRLNFSSNRQMLIQLG